MTNVPLLGSVRTSPRSARSLTARLAVSRAMPCLSASDCSEGSRSPGVSSPELICLVIRSANCTYTYSSGRHGLSDASGTAQR